MSDEEDLGIEIDLTRPERTIGAESWLRIRHYLLEAPDAEAAYSRCEAMAEWARIVSHELMNAGQVVSELLSADVYFVDGPDGGYSLIQKKEQADEPERSVPAAIAGVLIGGLCDDETSMVRLMTIEEVATEWQSRLSDDEKMVGHLVLSHGKGVELRGKTSDELYDMHVNMDECSVS